MSTTSLYDHAGPRARARNRILAVISGIVLALAMAWVIAKFGQAGQWDAYLWEPFLEASTWTNYILPGLGMTLLAALVGIIFSLIAGLLLAVGRLSEHRWVSIPTGAVVEFCRAVPVLIFIFFIFYGLPFLIGRPVPAFWAVVVGLTAYNGSVLAEAYRAGILALPKGQSEAAYALGFRKSSVMIHILMPQAARAMLPVIVSQMIILLKDTALGYIVAFPELMQRGINDLAANYGNVVAAAIVVAIIYIIVNSLLNALSHRIERWTR